MILRFEIFNPSLGLLCRLADPYESASYCRKVYQKTVSLDSLYNLGFDLPQNKTELHVLARQLNGLTRLTFRGLPIDGTQFSPNQISVTKFDLQD